MRTNTFFRVGRPLALATLLSVIPLDPVAAQEAESEAERRARLDRRGAAVRAGAWWADVAVPTGAEESAWPAIEGYFQKGLDRHLALESSITVWRRELSIEESGGVGGGTTRESVTSYVIPMLTAIKLYPFTAPADRLEPYVSAGAGFAIGVDDREVTSGGLLGLGSQSGVTTAVGFALAGTTGVEWRFSRAFGLTAGGGYRWARFGSEIGGARTFSGWSAQGGVVYRFQFD